MCAYMYVYYVILKLGFERCEGIGLVETGNCPGKLSGGIFRGDYDYEYRT